MTLAHSYEPYGETLSSAGSGTSVFQFAGEARDGTGLTFLRARYLDNGVGRFINRDEWSGDYQQPLSLNRWNFVEGNPINRIDPSGLWSCIGHPDCTVWVQNALNMLLASGETGRRLVGFFHQYDAQVKRETEATLRSAAEYAEAYGFSGVDCSSDGVTIHFKSGLGPWGRTMSDTVIELRDDPAIIGGPIPTRRGAITFGHEISHWTQGMYRFTVQGELLSQLAEEQLRLGMGAPNGDRLHARLIQYYPFSSGELWAARDYLAANTTSGFWYILMPLGGFLGPNWLSDLAIPIPQAPLQPIPMPVPTPPGPAHTPTPPGRTT